MYARLFVVRLEPGRSEIGEQLAKRWAAAAETLPGFVRVTFFGDDESGEGGYFSVWETERQALDAHFEVGAQLSEAIDAYAISKPEVRTFKVFEPPV